MVEFEYTDEITGDQLRILTLEPSDDEEAVVSCVLTTVFRDNCDPYEALSYCWGNDPPSDNILVNGRSFTVRENLGHALRHIRLPDRKRRLWVDAICICQERESNRERNEQVARMNETYSMCTKVIVWLGCTTERSTIALQAIRVRAAQFKGQSMFDVANSRVPLSAMVHGIEIAICMSAVAELLSRPWFSRMWVFQEVCLAPSVIMLCGHDMIRFSQFADFKLSLTLCPNLQQYVNTDKLESALGLLDNEMIFIRQVLQVKQEELPDGQNVIETRLNVCVMLKLLWSTRRRQCERPQDRYYALRCLALDIDRNVLEPNYSDDLGVTHAKVTLAMIEHSGKLDAMAFCRGPEAVNAAGLQRPSWAPDFDMHTWDPDNIAESGLLTTVIDIDAFFHATGESVAQPRHSNDHSELIVTGYDIGIIDACHRLTWLDGAIQQARATVEARVFNIENQLPTEIFWRTLITNRTADSRSATAEVEGAEFDLWWDMCSNPTKDAESISSTVNNYNRAYLQHGRVRWMFTTDTGWVGLCPNRLQNGDHVCLLAGGQTAFTIRAKGTKYEVVGETYVHGIMNGEHWRQLHDDGVRQTEFVLI